MALSPGISRVASGAVAYASNGFSGVPTPVADVVAAAPINQVDARELLARDSFQYSEFAPEQKRSRPDFLLSDSDRPGRRIVGSLFLTSTESFSIAFAPHPQFNVPPNAPGGANTKATVQQGIETYELTAAVIHDQLAPRGENLSITL
jgi:hypothetical protein